MPGFTETPFASTSIVDELAPYLAVDLARYVLLGCLLAAAVWVAVCARRNGRRAAWRALVGWLLVGWFAVIAILSLIRFNIRHFGAINLVPLRTIIDQFDSVNTSLAVINNLGNVLVYLPVGLLLPVLVPRWWSGIVAGAGVSLLMESTQYVTRRGAADIDDLLLNTLGAVVGAGIYLLARRLVRPPRVAPMKLQ